MVQNIFILQKHNFLLQRLISSNLSRKIHHFITQKNFFVHTRQTSQLMIKAHAYVPLPMTIGQVQKHGLI